MTVQLSRQLLLRCQYNRFSFVQLPKIEVGGSAVHNSACSGSMPYTLPSDANSSSPLPPLISKFWFHIAQASHSLSTSKSLYHPQSFHSLRPNFLYPYPRYISAKFSATPSSANFSQARSVVDDAAKREMQACWSCEQGTLTANGLFCSSCNSIQPQNPSLDYYQIFNIDRSFNLDLKILEQRYKELQKKLHPDLAGSKSQREQGYSADQSAHVIQAYYVLLRPLARARYLLGLYGIKVDEEDTIDDPKLLMEIMEIRESIEEATGVHELKQAQVENDKRIRECEKALESSFGIKDLKKAISTVQRFAYFIKVGEEITRKL